jgi:hypothetical protein
MSDTLRRASASLAIVAFAGCYTAFRPGAAAPIGHGHGGADFDLGVGVGGEYVGEHVRAGGGLAFGMHLESPAVAPVGVEGRLEANLNRPDDRGRRFVATGTAMFGYASGLPASAFQPGGPDGVIGQAFLGVGLSRDAQGEKLAGGTLALGALAIRFVPDSGNAFWLVGAGLDMTFRWDVERVMSGR